jgi:hypothetical protein
MTTAGMCQSYGHLWLTRRHPRGMSDPVLLCAELAVDDELIVDQADPRILINAELLCEVAIAGGDPRITLTFADDPPPGLWSGAFPHNPLGALLRIEGVNRTVIYRITEWGILQDVFVAEWPD